MVGSAIAAFNKTSPCVWPLAVIWPLLGRHIAFHRRLVDLTSSVKAALLLSQSIYWTRRGRDIALNGGWFHKTTEQWSWETGLSAKEQSSARVALKVLDLVDERRLGIPARLHFRLNTEQLGSLLAERIAVDPRTADWNDMVLVAEMLGPSVAYHRALAGIAGGAGKCAYAERELGCARCLDRHEPDLAGRLRAACPDGIDVYFDNVGGDHLDAAFALARDYARFAICGMIEKYNEADQGHEFKYILRTIPARINMRGYIFTDYAEFMPEFLADVAPMVLSGEMKMQETVHQGLESTFDAFLGLFSGANTGKMLVRL